MSYSCSLFTHIVSIDQATNCLQWAEGVVLSIVLTTAGIPDQVAALLISQDICCGSLRNEEMKNLSVAAERLKSSSLFFTYVFSSSTPCRGIVVTDHHIPEISSGLQMIITHLWYSGANYKPGFLAHRQEVVAQEHSMFFFISR